MAGLEELLINQGQRLGKLGKGCLWFLRVVGLGFNFIGRHDLVEILGCGALVIWSGAKGDLVDLGIEPVFNHGCRDNVRLFEGEWDGSIFNEILDFVFETDAIIGMMSGHLMVGT